MDGFPPPLRRCGRLRFGAARLGFTTVELLVVVGIILVLISIFLPYAMTLREASNRVGCHNNLKNIWTALDLYASHNDRQLPRVVYEPATRPAGYTAYSGADDPSPFARDSTVQPNDVTACLWLLIRDGYATPEMFICPSTSDSVDSPHTGRGVPTTQRSNFRGGTHLSYSYASPFSNAAGFRMNTDMLAWNFAVVADKNPGVSEDGDDVTGPSYTAPPMEMAHANSPQNHNRAGQNVLYVTGEIIFQRTPYCGVDHDNIYTARSATTQPAEPTTRASSQPATPSIVPDPPKGYFGRAFSPSTDKDSYLVPAREDGP